MSEAERTWLSVGEAAMAEGTEHEVNDGGEWRVEHRTITREMVERAINELDWVEPEGRQFPMSPGLAIQETIRELRLPRVSRVAIWNGTFNDGGYSFYGIEANYKDGRAHVYLLDRGHDIVPLAADYWKEAA